MHSAEPYDFVVVSSQLADMTGIDSCEKLLLNDPDLASLFLAGRGDEKLISRALSLGVSQYLVKDDDSDYLQLLPGIISNLQRRKVDTQKNQPSAAVRTDKVSDSEIRLRKSEERYRQIADISSDWIWELDADLRFCYLSEGLERITGIKPSTVLGKPRHEIASQIDIDKPHWQEHLADLEAHREFKKFQYSLVDPQGNKRYFQISGMPLFDENKTFQGYRGTASR